MLRWAGAALLVAVAAGVARAEPVVIDVDRRVVTAAQKLGPDVVFFTRKGDPLRALSFQVEGQVQNRPDLLA